MVGIPTLIQLVFVWLPDADLDWAVVHPLERPGLGRHPARRVTNYQYITQNYPPFWPAVQHNVLWLLFLALIATPLGLLLAVLLDQKIRGSRIYQSIFFTPVMLSLALIGIIWQLFYSRTTAC